MSYSALRCVILELILGKSLEPSIEFIELTVLSSIRKTSDVALVTLINPTGSGRACALSRDNEIVAATASLGSWYSIEYTELSSYGVDP
jgi:hypothetical protein